MNLMTRWRLTMACPFSLALLSMLVLVSSVARADEKDDAQMILNEAKLKIDSDIEGKGAIQPAFDAYKSTKAAATATQADYQKLLDDKVPVSDCDKEAIVGYINDATGKRILALANIDLAVDTLNVAVAAYNVADEAFQQEKWGQCSEYSNKAISRCTDVYIALCDAYSYLADSDMSIGAAQDIINCYKD